MKIERNRLPRWAALAFLTTLLLAGKLFAGTYTVRGQLVYYDDRNFSQQRVLDRVNGAWNVTWRVYDYDARSGDDLLAQGVLDGNGRFSTTFEYAQSEETHAELYVRYELRNSKWRVVGSTGAVYAMVTDTLTNATFGTHDFGSLMVDWFSDLENAMWVFQSMNEAWIYVEVNNGWNMGGQIRVQWPGQSSCPTSCANDDGIHITRARAFNTKNHIHEYGHMANYRAWGGMGPNTDYCRLESEPCGHSWSSLEYFYPSFIEGWAEFIAWGALGAIGNDDLLDLENRRFNTMAVGNEGNAAAVLNDILDSNYDSHFQNGFNGYDSIYWNLYGMIWILSHMSDDEIDDEPDIRHYVSEIREVYPSIGIGTWRRLMDNNWIRY